MIMRPLTDRKWRGYTFDELQEQILVNDIRIEIQKKRIEKRAEPIRQIGKSGKNIVSTAFSFLDYFDYIRLGFTVIRKVRSLFKRKKNR